MDMRRAIELATGYIPAEIDMFIEELGELGFYIAPLEQRPFDSTVYRDGEMRVM